MTTRIILVRHGETQWNKEGRYQGQIDTDLSDRGKEQGELLGEALKGIKIDIAYSSPLKRAFETAQAGLKYHDLEIGIVPGLTEISHGTWEGLLSSELKETHGVLVEQWHATPHLVQMPEGENLQQVQARAMAAIEELAEKHEGQTVLVVSHDATNKAIICGALGIDLSRFWQVKQDNTCINVLEYQDGRWRVALLNDTCHMGNIVSGIEQAAL